MQKTPDMAREDIIGCPVKVIDARNKSNLGIAGKIIDETKNFVIIETQRGVKKVNKEGSIFQMLHLGKSKTVSGDCLFGSPEERIKIK